MVWLWEVSRSTGTGQGSYPLLSENVGFTEAGTPYKWLQALTYVLCESRPESYQGCNQKGGKNERG